ncbi:hypothetical protein HDU78_007221 [Chytriomyces hyalinus]|nr:hypothetical protein HDU78_007221 [Chytriomyces hyalinus]KAJ3265498.1 hypothetical protein HDU77_005005 [Chytriomyces hyalinus]
MQRAAKKLITQLQNAGLAKHILPKKDLTSKFANGNMGTFVPPIQKLTIVYNHPGAGHGGDSRGMVDFIHTQLAELAARRPYVEFEVVQRPSAPAELQALYVNGGLKRHVCYRLTQADILKHAEYLCDTSAAPNVPKLIEKEESTVIAEAGEKAPWVRTRKTPRGSGNEARKINLKMTDHLDFKPSYWKHVKATDWKTVGRPTDRKFTWPVLHVGPNPPPVWSPFSAERTFKP